MIGLFRDIFDAGVKTILATANDTFTVTNRKFTHVILKGTNFDLSTITLSGVCNTDFIVGTWLEPWTGKQLSDLADLTLGQNQNTVLAIEIGHLELEDGQNLSITINNGTAGTIEVSASFVETNYLPEHQFYYGKNVQTKDVLKDCDMIFADITGITSTSTPTASEAFKMLVKQPSGNEVTLSANNLFACHALVKEDFGVPDMAMLYFGIMKPVELGWEVKSGTLAGIFFRRLVTKLEITAVSSVNQLNYQKKYLEQVERTNRDSYKFLNYTGAMPKVADVKTAVAHFHSQNAAKGYHKKVKPSKIGKGL